MNSRLQGYTILVVDDEPEIREMIAEDLRGCGATTLEAQDGEVALKLVTAEAPDIVVSDIRMPNLDGIQLLASIQNLSLAAKRPLVFLMSGQTDRLVSELLHEGAHAFFEKPFHLQDLREAIVKAVLISRQTPTKHA